MSFLFFVAFNVSVPLIVIIGMSAIILTPLWDFFIKEQFNSPKSILIMYAIVILLIASCGFILGLVYSISV